jgi:hypothetical protein
MRKYYFIFLLISCSIYSQNDYFHLENLTSADIVKVEFKFGSQQFNDSNKVVAESDSSHLSHYNFRRDVTELFPAAIVQYFFSKSDSIVRSIIFNWKLEIEQKLRQSEKVQKYNIAFDRLVNSMVTVLGPPAPDQGQLTEIESPVAGDKSQNFQREVIWKIENRTIVARIVWAEDHGEQMITFIR